MTKKNVNYPLSASNDPFAGSQDSFIKASTRRDPFYDPYDFDEDENKPKVSKEVIEIADYSIVRTTASGNAKSYLRLLIDFVGINSDMFKNSDEQEKNKLYYRAINNALNNNVDVDPEVLKITYGNHFLSCTGSENKESGIYQFLSFLLQDGCFDTLPSERFIKQIKSDIGRNSGKGKHEPMALVRQRALELAENNILEVEEINDKPDISGICDKIHPEVYEFACELFPNKGQPISVDPQQTLYKNWVLPYNQIRTTAIYLANIERQNHQNKSKEDICSSIYPKLLEYVKSSEKRNRVIDFTASHERLLETWIK